MSTQNQDIECDSSDDEKDYENENSSRRRNLFMGQGVGKANKIFPLMDFKGDLELSEMSQREKELQKLNLLKSRAYAEQKHNLDMIAQ